MYGCPKLSGSSFDILSIQGHVFFMEKGPNATVAIYFIFFVLFFKEKDFIDHLMISFTRFVIILFPYATTVGLK